MRMSMEIPVVALCNATIVLGGVGTVAFRAEPRQEWIPKGLKISFQMFLAGSSYELMCRYR